MAPPLHTELIMGKKMWKPAFTITAMLASACVVPESEPEVTLDPIYAPRTGDYEEDNGSPPWHAYHLINVMSGNGHLNSYDHRRYEEKVRTITGIGGGPIKDPIDQEIVGAMLGVLTNTSGMVVHLKLAAVAFGDYPDIEWKREDRAHTFRLVNGKTVEAHFCMGDDVAAGVQDPTRADSYAGKDLGAAIATKTACSDMADFQQKDQAYANVTPEPGLSATYAKTAVLAMLQDPVDGDFWHCVEVGQCKLGSCNGTWALFKGTPRCMPCRMSQVVIDPNDGPRCTSR